MSGPMEGALLCSIDRTEGASVGPFGCSIVGQSFDRNRLRP